MTTDTARPILLEPGAGRALWTMGLLMTVKADNESTGSVLSGMEVLLPPQIATPVHIHHREAEVNYVLEGSMGFRCGEEDIEAVPGAFIFLPRGVPHAFRTGDDGAKMLALTVPGGLERLYELVGRDADALQLPEDQPNIQGWIQHAGDFGLEIVAPPIA